MVLNELFGYLSGIVILLSFFPYLRDILAKKTKPERASWFIWTVLGTIITFSQLYKGASYSLIVSAAQVVGDFFIFILALKYGIGGFLKRDIFALCGATIALIFWYFTKEAATALFIGIFIDATGTFLTTIKSYEKPETETVSSWLLTFVAGFLGCLSVGSLNLILLAFPIYVCLASISIISAIYFGLKRKIIYGTR